MFINMFSLTMVLAYLTWSHLGPDMGIFFSRFSSVVSYVSAWYSLHINCGGREVDVAGNATYEADIDIAGASRFYQSTTNWAFSTTGYFLDDDLPTDSYIWTNSSKLSMNDSRLYMNARLSPISLTYYGFCMGNGNYTVNLHFAEIMFSNDNTYNSLGRRIFDIYLQVVILYCSYFTFFGLGQT